MRRIVGMIVLQPFEDFRRLHLSFGGNQRYRAFVKCFPVERRAVGYLAEGLGCLVIMLLRKPRFADAQPKDDGFVACCDEAEKGDLGFPELTAVEGEVGKPELRAEMIRRCGKNLPEGNARLAFLTALVEFQGLFVNETDAARVERAAEIVARARKI